MSRAHPNCWTGSYYEHDTCLVPSGRTCIEPDCDRAAGTKWGPLWCPVCDVERLDRVSASLARMAQAKGR